MPSRHWALLSEIIAFVALVAIAVPVTAHHGFQAEYDGSKIIYVTGTLTKVDWANPHIYVHVDAKDDQGKVTSWMFEGSATTLVERNGTHRSDLVSNIGKTVSIRATPGRNGIPRGAAETIKLEDGRELIVGGRRYTGGGNNIGN
jgi:uncharacterized protein DUF6152